MLTATLTLLLAASWMCIHWDLDRTIAARFYTPGQGWLEKEAQPWHGLYLYGTFPGIVLTLACLVGWIWVRFRSPESQWHKYFLLVVLTSVLGAGILVNGFLKPYWGRPRPNQIRELGGKYDYHHVLTPGIAGKGKSFPCGHCTMGYLFVALFYFRRKSPALAYTGGSFGLIYGSVVGMARVVQGAHFASDCLWSLGVIWLTASALYFFILKIPSVKKLRPSPLNTRQKRLMAAIAALLAALIIVGFMTRRPFFETYYNAGSLWSVESEIRELRVGLRGGFDSMKIRYTDDPHVLVLIHSQGFAWPGCAQFLSIDQSKRVGETFEIVYRLDAKGYFSELTHEIEVTLPRRLKERIRVVFLDEAGKPQEVKNPDPTD
ncbi:MAG: phosphatase PAP2 family protein [Desulfobacterales bacterium]|nr:phosphatase PAP2 family protein [Desulfobacterales bacterium]